MKISKSRNHIRYFLCELFYSTEFKVNKTADSHWISVNGYKVFLSKIFVSNIYVKFFFCCKIDNKKIKIKKGRIFKTYGIELTVYQLPNH